jgi:Mrp family chromosome partitioning ATPase
MKLMNWQRCIEQIVLANQQEKLLGFTSARRGAGVSLTSRLTAMTIASAGTKTLLVDMSDPGSLVVRHDNRPPLAKDLREHIVSTEHGYDLLPGRHDVERLAFARLPRLREMLLTEFMDYKQVVIDLPPILEALGGGFNTITAAAICDRLLLVCTVGTERRSEVVGVVSLLRSSGITLSGVVSNEHSQPASRKQRSQKNTQRVQR